MLIEVFHDTACPWCRIGKRHLDLALEGWRREPVEVQFRSFFLNPNIPAGGFDFHNYMRAKGEGRIPLEQFFAAPRERGAAVGLAFHFERITRAPNTLLSHRLIALAPLAQKKGVIDAIYAAYFEHGQDIGDLDALAHIAAAQGLDGQAVRRALEGDEGLAQVMADVQEAQALGVSGVPFLIFDRRYAVSGAQPVDVLGSVIQQVLDGRQGESK
jgi:predicted DsbA family dithiol-disulfide isomerase